jgi:hypothetical protein
VEPQGSCVIRTATRDDDRAEQLGGVVDQLDQLYGKSGRWLWLSEIFSSREALIRERYVALIADDGEDRPALCTRSLTADERRKLRAYTPSVGPDLATR